MYETAETFFKSLGFDSLPESFWKGSLLQKRSDRDVRCQGTAFDFQNGKDLRYGVCYLNAMWMWKFHNLSLIIWFFSDECHKKNIVIVVVCSSCKKPLIDWLIDWLILYLLGLCFAQKSLIGISWLFIMKWVIFITS